MTIADATRHRIYVAGPYSANCLHDVAANVRAAVNAAEVCWAKGHEAFCPHSHSHAIACRAVLEGRPIEYERWMEQGLWLIDNWATALLFIEHSSGSDRELERAISHSHTIFRSADDVPDARERPQRRNETDDTGSTGAREEAGEEGAPAADTDGSSAGSLTEHEAVELHRPVRVAPPKETP